MFGKIRSKNFFFFKLGDLNVAFFFPGRGKKRKTNFFPPAFKQIKSDFNCWGGNPFFRNFLPFSWEKVNFITTLWKSIIKGDSPQFQEIFFSPPKRVRPFLNSQPSQFLQTTKEPRKGGFWKRVKWVFFPGFPPKNFFFGFLSRGKKSNKEKMNRRHGAGGKKKEKPKSIRDNNPRKKVF